MRIVDRLTARMIGGSLVLSLLVSSCAMALPAPQAENNTQANQQEPSPQTAPSPPAIPPNAEQLPDSPGAGQTQAPASSEPSENRASTGAQAPSSIQQSPPNAKSKPVGTAAAEVSSTTGFAAARPSGSALAPAKQKRVRTILISVGAVAGAAVALGIVMGLSRGTPSRPPGSQ